MDGSTRKRRGLRNLLTGASALGLTRLLARRLDRAKEAELAHLCGPLWDVAHERAMDVQALAVFWPSHDRAHRRYIVAVDKAGQPQLFCKTTVSPVLDASHLRREARILEGLANHPLEGWRVPRLFAFLESATRADLVVEALPLRRRRLSWSEILPRLPLASENAEAPLPPSGAHGEGDWIAAACALDLRGGAARHLRRLVVDPPPLAFANADVRPANAVRTTTDYWLFDWEYASHCAPRGTDLAAASLNMTLEVDGQSLHTERLRQLVTTRAVAHGLSETDLLNGLLYLATVGHVSAQRLVREAQW